MILGIHVCSLTRRTCFSKSEYRVASESGVSAVRTELAERIRRESFTCFGRHVSECMRWGRTAERGWDERRAPSRESPIPVVTPIPTSLGRRKVVRLGLNACSLVSSSSLTRLGNWTTESQPPPKLQQSARCSCFPNPSFHPSSFTPQQWVEQDMVLRHLVHQGQTRSTSSHSQSPE